MKQVGSLVVLISSLLVSHLVVSKDFAIQEIVLEKATKSLSSKLVLEEQIIKLQIHGDTLLAFSRRAAWVSKDGLKFSKLDIFKDAPKDTDWINQVCTVKGISLISIASYPEELRLKEQSSALGAYRRGPKNRGLLVMKDGKVEFINEIHIHSYSEILLSSFEELPREIFQLPKTLEDAHVIQSCAYDDEQLIVAGYGFLAQVDINNFSAKLIEYESFGLELNRNAIYATKEEVWVSEDEGGSAGGCISAHYKDERQSFCLLNYNNNVIHTNAIFRHQDSIYTSSLAGLVKVDRQNKNFVHYKLSNDPKQMRLYDAQSIDNVIWGVKEDGFVKIEIDEAKYTLFNLNNESNDIYSLVEFKGAVYVSNDAKLFVIDKKELKRL